MVETWRLPPPLRSPGIPLKKKDRIVIAPPTKALRAAMCNGSYPVKTGASIKKTPSMTLIHRTTRVTSAMAMMATHTTSGPTMWSTIRSGPSYSRTSGAAMSQTPSSMTSRWFHISLNDRLSLSLISLMVVLDPVEAPSLAPFGRTCIFFR